MKYKFKKVYVEISNICNLSCPFCLKSTKEKRSLSIDEFDVIINKLKPYTKYLYFHVLGEPLLHKDINLFINNLGYFVNITSNGYLINKLQSKIRQINISLHSFNERYNKSLNEYLDDIYKYYLNNYENTYINLRLWSKSKYLNDITNYLNNKFNIKIDLSLNNMKLSDNLFLNIDNEFVWPDDNKSDQIYFGKCYALKDHIAILSDGTIVPCCLDGNGKIMLGNIFNDDLKDVFSSSNYKKLEEELSNGIRSNKLCQKCNFLDVKN